MDLNSSAHIVDLSEEYIGLSAHGRSEWKKVEREKELIEMTTQIQDNIWKVLSSILWWILEKINQVLFYMLSALQM